MCSIQQRAALPEEEPKAACSLYRLHCDPDRRALPSLFPLSSSPDPAFSLEIVIMGWWAAAVTRSKPLVHGLRTPGVTAAKVY